MLDKKSKNFFAIFSLLIILSIMVAYYRYIIFQDFNITTDEEVFYEELEFYE